MKKNAFIQLWTDIYYKVVTRNAITDGWDMLFFLVVLLNLIGMVNCAVCLNFDGALIFVVVALIVSYSLFREEYDRFFSSL